MLLGLKTLQWTAWVIFNLKEVTYELNKNSKLQVFTPYGVSNFFARVRVGYTVIVTNFSVVQIVIFSSVILVKVINMSLFLMFFSPPILR